MKILVNNIPAVTIEDFARQHGLGMVVTERPAVPIGSHEQYYAWFEGTDRGGVYGDGRSPSNAIDAYAAAISHTTLTVRDVDTDYVRTLAVPLLISATRPHSYVALSRDQLAAAVVPAVILARAILTVAGVLGHDTDQWVTVDEANQEDIAEESVEIADALLEALSRRDPEPVPAHAADREIG